MKCLLESGADANVFADTGLTSLFVALGLDLERESLDNADLVGYFLARGAKIDAKTDEGRTALGIANLLSHAAIVKVLEDAAEAKK